MYKWTKIWLMGSTRIFFIHNALLFINAKFTECLLQHFRANNYFKALRTNQLTEVPNTIRSVYIDKWEQKNTKKELQPKIWFSNVQTMETNEISATNDNDTSSVQSLYHQLIRWSSQSSSCASIINAPPYLYAIPFQPNSSGTQID